MNFSAAKNNSVLFTRFFFPWVALTAPKLFCLKSKWGNATQSCSMSIQTNYHFDSFCRFDHSLHGGFEVLTRCHNKNQPLSNQITHMQVQSTDRAFVTQQFSWWKQHFISALIAHSTTAQFNSFFLVCSACIALVGRSPTFPSFWLKVRYQRLV